MTDLLNNSILELVKSLQFNGELEKPLLVPYVCPTGGTE
ncbi:hypothetical protein M2135_001673 [Parabacteroides sp. PF5-9]|nr:hypothetical protein [Parabacteroides sp. PF5-9]